MPRPSPQPAGPFFFRSAVLGLLLVLPPLAAPAQDSRPAEAAPAQSAAQRQARLDALFAALKAARADLEANEYVAEIWRTWSEAGRPDVDALMARAGSGMQNQDFGLASLLLDEVVELAPGFAEGWNRRATLRYMMGDHDGSLADIEKVLALEPRHFGALSGRAMIHAAAERWKEALTAYRAALAANPFLPDRERMLAELQRRVEGGRL